jgi:hypothetical protein
MKTPSIFLLFLFILQSKHFVLAQPTNVYKAQALYIYNFTKYINWKGSAEEFSIGVYGESEILTELQTMLKGKVVGIKPIQVKQIKDAADFETCHIIYVSSGKSGEIDKINQTTRSKGILVVSEDDLSAKGASISFVQVNNKLRFKIRQQSLQDAGLQVSDMLLTQGIVD